MNTTLLTLSSLFASADSIETTVILHKVKAVSCYHMVLSMSNVFVDQSR